VRRLGTEEQQMWDRVAATIRPLSREPIKASATAGPPNRQQRIIARPVAQPTSGAPRSRPRIDDLSKKTLDSSWDRRLRSGTTEPDRVLDLHGKTLDQAWSAIDRALERAIAEDERVLLLITGHARSGDPPLQRGKIRSAVNDWLQVSRHASRIAAVRGAHARHGGGGSLYIVLRRNRPISTFS
jgi:DNA-nicking Smr family endonuclease